jgi:hypothetical protein
MQLNFRAFLTPENFTLPDANLLFGSVMCYVSIVYTNFI